MDFQALKTAYLAQHWRSVDDTARMHLTGFAAFCETAQVEAQADAEPKALAAAPESKTLADSAPAA